MTPEQRSSYFLEQYQSPHVADINDEFDVVLFTMLFMNGSFFDMAIVPHSEVALDWVRHYLTETLRCDRVDPAEWIGDYQPGDECYKYGGGAMSVRVRPTAESPA